MKFCFNSKSFVELTIAPNKLAVVGDDFSLTWQSFALEVEKLVVFFKHHQLENINTPVIIYGHKSANMICSMYALMQLEIPYIPVDTIYPKERIEKIVETVECQLIINTTSEQLNFQGVNEVFYSENNCELNLVNLIQTQKVKQLDPTIYIIFTSGSTGEPKGVQITTEAIQSFTKWMGSNDFKFTSSDTFINTALLSFDLSVFEVMTFAYLGGTLLLNSTAQSSNPAVLMNRVEEHQGSVWVSTPSFALTYSRIKDTEQLKSISTFLFCGEVLPNALVKKLFANYSTARVINTYGPTEATVATTVVQITEEILENHDPLPVGKSKPDSQIIIQDKEIVIVGPNVSIGYFKNDQLNAQKFITLNNQRAFKTGDEGYLENGYLFFYGRNDDLVKLHGYRIELNEITGALSNLDFVVFAETLPLKRDGITKKIVSFVQLEEGTNKSIQDLKEALLQTLPHYMIPGDIILIDKFPLNQNGKVDKRQLMKEHFNQ